VRDVLLLALLGVVVLAAWRWGWWRSRDDARSPSATRTVANSPPAASAPPPVEFVPIAVPPIPPAAELTVTDGDFTAAQDLSRRLSLQLPVTSADLAVAESLVSRHPDQQPLRRLLSATLVVAARQDQTARRYDVAAATLRRAVSLTPREPALRLALADLLTEAGDFAGGEAAAREAIALNPGDGDALERLGYALFRQDRNREAAETLRAALDARPSDFAQKLLARIQKTLADESGMTEQHLSHFNVRYDGDAHEDVGREILRALERHHATLVRTFDHQPSATIPVILFTRTAYYDASGAPTWSGGVFDHTDARIRIPIQGLTTDLTPDMDGTLIHELAHAFIHDRSRALAPREIHEGLAQYLEGKRIASMLTPEQVTSLADGRIGGVAAFYAGALSFVEHLMALRGQGGLNDLLKVMGESTNVDEAFRRVYGSDFQTTRRAWFARLRQQHGS
jgi:tetratricopeptide (TPR) repeat protein